MHFFVAQLSRPRRRRRSRESIENPLDTQRLETVHIRSPRHRIRRPAGRPFINPDFIAVALRPRVDGGNDSRAPHFLHDTNADVLAFHEGFSDIVAIFQHFTFQKVLAATIQRTRGNLRSRTALGSLAQQFGYATGGGRALREALEADGKTDPTLYDRLEEPHERGSVLVASVFDAFFDVYQARIQDLVRIATAGTGRLPDE